MVYVLPSATEELTRLGRERGYVNFDIGMTKDKRLYVYERESGRLVGNVIDINYDDPHQGLRVVTVSFNVLHPEPVGGK